MRITSRIILLCILAAFIVGTGAAQTTAVRQRKATGAKAAAKRDPRAEAAGRVAEQVKVLAKFLYLFGSIRKDLAATDAALKSGEAKSDLATQARRNKAALLSSLQNVRDGLDKLEADFRFTPQLQPYYLKLKGVAEAASGAEEQAASGDYEDAGRTLLEVVNQLTDVLLAMR